MLSTFTHLLPVPFPFPAACSNPDTFAHVISFTIPALNFKGHHFQEFPRLLLPSRKLAASTRPLWLSVFFTTPCAFQATAGGTGGEEEHGANLNTILDQLHSMS